MSDDAGKALSGSRQRTSLRRIGSAVLAWIVIGLVWLALTHDFHPNLTVAAIVTATLVSAYALAAFANHLWLIPKYWRARRYLAYAGVLGATMALLTALALAVICVPYTRIEGRIPDLERLAYNYAIDLFGMVVHVVGAALVVAVERYYSLRVAGRSRP